MTLQALMLCVSLLTGLPLPAETPKVVILTFDEIVKNYPSHSKHWGWFNAVPEPGTVFLRNDKTEFKAHELTHQAQIYMFVNKSMSKKERHKILYKRMYLMHYDVGLRRATERQAKRVQLRWANGECRDKK